MRKKRSFVKQLGLGALKVYQCLLILADWFWTIPGIYWVLSTGAFCVICGKSYDYITLPAPLKHEHLGFVIFIFSSIMAAISLVVAFHSFRRQSAIFVDEAQTD